MSTSQSAPLVLWKGKSGVKPNGLGPPVSLVDDRRIQEINLALRQTFEEAVQTQLFPRSQIDISVLVLEQDGGSLRPRTG